MQTRQFLTMLACAALVTACSKPGPATNNNAHGNPPAELQTDTQKFSYAVGFDMGRSLSQVKDGIDLPTLEQGIEESLAGQPARLSEQQRAEIKTTIIRKLEQQQIAAYQEAATKNQEQGNKFLADNGKKPGVKTTASGLQYEVITEGAGKHPGPTDRVLVNYKGTLIDGTVFDSTYERKQPATLAVGSLFPGWKESMQLMTPGSKYRFYVPASLAYGSQSPNSKIGPNAVLILEVELLNVDSAAPVPPPAVAGKPR